MPRPARRRGGDGVRRGVSGDKVSVLACANVRGGVFLREACRGKMGEGDARAALAGCALAGSVVSTDMQKGYVGALRAMGVAVHRRFASGGAEGPLEPRELGALGAQGVPRPVQGRVHQAPPRLPLLVHVGARGQALRRPRRTARGPDAVLPVRADVEAEGRRSIPLPSGGEHVKRGLTEPGAKRLHSFWRENTSSRRHAPA